VKERAVLTDIEGTTTSLSFVKDVLFPYARRHIAGFVRNNSNDPEVTAQIEAVRKQAGNMQMSLDQVIEHLHEWIDQDRKITSLKSLQGLLWAHGYAAGDYHGHVYADAVAALRAWKQAGISLNVFSSGSVLAQRLLFAHTGAGDLTGLFDAYFDTTVGAKTDPGSYRRIAASMQIPPEDIVFLSDIEAELDAARMAGMQTIQLLRDGQPAPGAHLLARDFSQIRLEPRGK